MNELIDKLLPFENDLFLAINGSGSVFWDNAMWTYTGVMTWVPLIFIIVYLTFKNQLYKEGVLVLGSIVLVLLLSSLVSATLFKPTFQRYRPSHHPDYKDIVKVLNDFRGGDYGFVSGHATNSFGLAFLFYRLFKNRFVTISIMLWAALNSYSRVYLGVHFISDIVAGFVIGMFIGLLVYEVYVKIRARYFNISLSVKRESIYSKKQSNLLGAVIVSYIALIILLSPFLSSFSHSVIPESWF